jgi:hypothetical protein
LPRATALHKHLHPSPDGNLHNPFAGLGSRPPKQPLVLPLQHNISATFTCYVRGSTTERALLFHLSKAITRPFTGSRESCCSRMAAGPCSYLRKLLVQVLTRRLVALVGMAGDVVGCWCRRCTPRVMVGAEDGRGSLFGGGRGCGSEMGADSRSRYTISVKLRGALKGSESTWTMGCSCMNRVSRERTVIPTRKFSGCKGNVSIVVRQ